MWVLGGAARWRGVKRCRDGNVCMSSRSCLGHFSRFSIPTLMVHFLKCFSCDLFLPFLGRVFVYHNGVSCCSLVW